MNVLVGVNGTERSFHALEFCSRLLSPKVDDIHLYYSLPKLKLAAPSQDAGELSQLASEALAQRVFELATARLPETFHSIVDTMTGHHKACDGILTAAEQKRADLIVIGGHGASHRLPFFVGGSARKIAHNSPLPVLMVREGQSIPSNGMNVLIACDEDQHWRDATNLLREFSWPEGSKATLFHVVDTMDEEEVEQLAQHAHPSIPDSESLIRQYRANVEKQKAARLDCLGQDREGMPSLLQKAELKVVQGHIVESILKEVERSSIDLVVIGARQLSALGRLLGSTTEGLLIQCPCALLIVHPFEDA